MPPDTRVTNTTNLFKKPKHAPEGQYQIFQKTAKVLKFASPNVDINKI